MNDPADASVATFHPLLRERREAVWITRKPPEGKTMCDYRAGNLILSHHQSDPWGLALMEDVRNGRVPGVKLADELADKLERHRVVLRPLSWRIYLLDVVSGEEHWQINALYRLYLAKARTLFSAWTPVRPGDGLLVAPNAVLSLEMATLLPDHATFKSSLGLLARLTSGSGVTVAIADSGLESAATWPRRRVDLWLAGGDAHDLDGHGTAVGALVHDLAPHANVDVIKIADAHDLSEWDALAGLHVARDAHVINLSWSFGFPTFTCPHCKRQSHTSRSAIFENVLESVLEMPHEPIVVAAAGNQSLSSVRYPARFADAVAVGALDASGRCASYSNYGTATAHATGGHPNLFFAPGGDTGHPAVSTTIGASPATPHHGTSVACAYATSVIARVRGARPTATRAQILDYLRHAATGIAPAASHGNGLIQDC